MAFTPLANQANPNFIRWLNVNGSGISLGHPIGATGGRILATMVNELHRREARIWARDHVYWLWAVFWST
jgi:acetyl-CoA acetyltransferase